MVTVSACSVFSAIARASKPSAVVLCRLAPRLMSKHTCLEPRENKTVNILHFYLLSASDFIIYELASGCTAEFILIKTRRILQ